MRKNKIAVLIPTFNAGGLLAESIASVAAAGLPKEAYEIIVSDNASDDGSIEKLSGADAQGAPIHLNRNGANLGRVQNWNCAIAAAEEMGFGHALFLMTGDLVRDDSVMALRRRMRETGALLGLGSFEKVDENLRSLGLARRVVWRARGGVSARRFLAQSFGIGAMLLAPLGANLYDLSGPRLRFDPADPSHTDQAATAAFLMAGRRPLVYLDRPIMQWRRRAGRFHSNMDLNERLAKDKALMLKVCGEAGVVPDAQEIRCTFMLRTIFHSKGNISAALPHFMNLARDPPPIRWSFLTMLLMRGLIYKTPWQISD
jgi:glycosyltransferase involved in cell wall biosynthesis